VRKLTGVHPGCTGTVVEVVVDTTGSGTSAGSVVLELGRRLETVAGPGLWRGPEHAAAKSPSAARRIGRLRGSREDSWRFLRAFILASGASRSLKDWFSRVVPMTDVRRRPLPRRVTDDHEEPTTRASKGVESNARLTASTAVVLLVLLAAEGFTILAIRPLLSLHVFIGMLLVPPVLLKMGSTSYRFVRYYRGSPAYRRKGPPPAVLRLLGPFVVVTTVAVFASGIALLLVGHGERSQMLLLHKASFVLWFGAMTIHVLGHLVDTARLAPRDFLRRTRLDVRGAGARQWAVVSSVVLGVPLGLMLLGRVGPWLASGAH